MRSPRGNRQNTLINNIELKTKREKSITLNKDCWVLI